MRGKPGPKWTVHVAAAPEATYAYLVEVTQHPEWGMDDMTVEAETPGPTKVGSRYKAEGTLQGKRNPSTVVITDLDPPRRIEFEAEDKRGISGHVFTLTAQDGGTQVTRQIYGVKQPFIAPLFLLLFKGAIDQNFNGALAKLKTRLDTKTA